MTLSTYSIQASHLAENALRLRGMDFHTFVEQFVSHAEKPSVVRVDGDGKLYRQALCFPVIGSVAETDTILPFPVLPPNLLVELASGHVIGFRLNDPTPARLSVSAFMTSIERYLDLLMKRDMYSWAGIQQMIEGAQRQRIKLFDFVLRDDPDAFWEHYFPQGAVRLANKVLHGLPFSDSGRKKVIAALSNIHTEHYRNVCGTFLERLDKDRIKAICVSGLPPQISRYNTFQNSNANSIYRIQAAEAIPLLSYLLGSDDYRAERLRRLVDEGQPLWPALADTLCVPEEVIRWLRNRTAGDVGDAWLGRVHKLLPDLASLPPEKRPKTPAEWTAYTDFILALNQPEASYRKKPWLKDLARLGWVQARQKFAAMNASPSDLFDVDDFVYNLKDALHYELHPDDELQPYAFRDHDHYRELSRVVDQLFFGASILKQVRASLRWHELQLQPPEEETPEDAPDSRCLSNWPAPLPAPLKLGDLYAHFLVSPAQLKDEGMRMQHCVGGYAYSCLYGGSSIVSFRDAQERSISTAELRLEDHGKLIRMKVIQHKARHNGTPPSAAEFALQQLLLALHEDEMQPRLSDMREQLARRQARDKQSRRWMEYRPNTPEQLRILESALKLHIGYQQFMDAGRKVIDA